MLGSPSFRGNDGLSQPRLAHLASRDHHTSLWDAGDQVREEPRTAAERGGRRELEAALEITAQVMSLQVMSQAG